MSVVTVKDRGGDTMEFLQLKDGYRSPKFFVPIEEVIEGWEKLPEFRCKDDDIMLWTFIKTGTNWMFEVLMMLLHKKAERVKTVKLFTDLEGQKPSVIDAAPSPRVLNTHVHYRYFPEDVLKKKMKTVLCLRNPKDTAVSYYNHAHNLLFYNYCGKWENWLPGYINGEYEYPTYATFLEECEKAIKDEVLPIHVMYYEDLKENGVEEIKKLVKFLELDIDDDLIAAIEELCRFDKMKDKYSPDNRKLILKENCEFFRKGEVGDWKSWFTVAQNEAFDKDWNEKVKSSMFKFKYELP